MAVDNSRQYRATRLWNDVVRTLRSSMPVGRHRKNMRMYEDSFVASEAVDWLLQHLRMNPNFEPDVSRDQTIALLRKFQKMGIIQDARGPDHKSVNVPFDDNSRLFRITNIVLHSPAVRPQRCVDQSSPASSRSAKTTDLRTPLTDVTRRSSNAESNAGWRHSVPSWIGGTTESAKAGRTTPAVSADETESVIPYIDDASPVPRVNALQVTSPLPDVVSDVAQNTFLNGPEVNDQGELHVWLDVVLARLKSLLRLKHLGDVISDPSSLNSHHVRHNFINVSQNGLVTNIEKSEHLPYWILSAMKYLAHGHSLDDSEILPGPFSGLKNYHGFERDMFVAVRDYFRCLPEPLIPIQCYDVFVNVLAHVNNFVNLESSMHSACGLANASNASDVPLFSSWDGSEMREKPSQKGDVSGADALSKSCAEMMQEIGRDEGKPVDIVFKVPPIPPPRGRRCVSPSVEYLETSFDGASSASITRRRRCCRRWPNANAAKRNTVGPFVNQGFPEKSSFKSPDRVKAHAVKNFIVPGKLAWSPRFSSETDVCHGPQLPENQLARQTGTTALDQMVSTAKCMTSARRSASFNAALNLHSSEAQWTADSSVASAGDSILSSTSSVTSHLPRDRDTLLLQSLQLCCLLLPPARRRRLHLLLRFMAKVAALDDQYLAFHSAPIGREECRSANRELVITSFAATILRKNVSIPVDHVNGPLMGEGRDVFAQQLVAFFVAHYAEIMRVPEEMRANIEERVNSLERARVESRVFDLPELRTTGEVPLERPFCRQVSVDEYETHRGKNLAEALKQLLDSIVDNQKLSSREKKRRLRQFRNAHPEVYSQRFPSAAAETAYFASLPKDTVFGWTLQKLKNMRL